MSDEVDVRRLSIDPERTLPGEEITSEDPADARHWVAVYSQLLATKRHLISDLREMMERQSQEVRDELERADVRLLELQIERFQHRLAFWEGKREGENRDRSAYR